uniref:Connector enhancer of kinase suppressor of Ras 1 n=1 Tax=Cynoglossus semilaevis TaxID=244447 RepID=A0A3P8UT18_CYNSE
MEPITTWSEERVSEWLQGLDVPLHQYSVSEWNLSGLDLLQLTSRDLEKLGVHKIGHQELILEAVEKLCSLTYGIGGENLRGLTEKLRAVAHTLQMGIQGRWRSNRYDGHSASKLPVGILQVVVEVITSAKGLFFLLNRSDNTVYEKEKDIITICCHIVAECDQILNSSTEVLLNHTAQLESVDLVPAAPGDQLGIEIASTGSSNHYVTGTAVGWSKENLVKKLKENPNGVTLVLKKIPGLKEEDERSQKEEKEEKEEEENPRHSIFERVAASVNYVYFCQIWHTINLHTFLGMSTAMSRRRVSCKELGRPDCDGWLWKKRKDSSVFIAQKWQRFWFVLKGPSLYWYTSQQDEKAEGFINISSYNIESAGEHKRKYVFKMCHQRFQNFFFAADNVTEMSKWINCLITAIQKHKKLSRGPDSEEECYSETESESESSPSPRRRNKKVQSNTLPRPKSKPSRAPLSNVTTGGSKGAGYTEDEMGKMLNNIKEGGVSLIGNEQPFTHDHFRRSFIRRNKNPVINEKAHTLRVLQSTLKAKEAELLQIDKILEDSELTATKYRMWKEQNEELVHEIEKLTALKETASSGTAYGLNLSEGEQLVDAELSDVHLDIPQGSLLTPSSPMLELSETPPTSPPTFDF